MRVLQLTTELEPHVWGGMGRSVSHLCKDLGQITELTVVVNDYLFGREQIEVEERDGFRIIWTPTTSFEDLSNVIDFAAIDVVNVQIFFFRDLAQQLKQQGKSIVYTIRSVEAEDLRIRGVEILPMHHEFMKMQKDLVEMADHLIVCSSAEGAIVERYFPGVASKLAVIPNGFKDPGDVLPDVLETSDNAPTLLYVGRFTERKGLDILIEALNQARTRVPGVRLRVVGGHSGEDDREWLNRLLDSYDEALHNCVEYAGWAESLEELELHYRASDILCAPSLYEPFGNIVLEGFYHGTPVIASAVGGMAEIIQHGETGLLVPMKDSKALAEAIVQLIEQPEKRAKLAVQAHHRLRSTYNWRGIAEQTLALYERVFAMR